MTDMLIHPTTSATTSFPFAVQYPPAVVRCTGLAGAETYTLQWDAGGGKFENVPATDYQLTVTEPKLRIDVPGNYQLVKSATAGLSSASLN